ncbi:peptide chain release factor N(5)-glutamine methyltransferase [Paenibacillus antri]|uniref:Release factor glutamine methyltransferase n=1 Tax=Paenibacillus antri TaxID=2582848 RepID=A0A5R9G2R0_9BACL|nr:peptide chain release factor N(5)-glutamine methyltransferase [Paenibacillus antri]TLS50642.1 peptide chain release factor N(5)-glutamine methyltransferase [Paenibacillus antri]
MTVREAFMRASSFLGERGTSEAPASAELLLQYVLGVTRTKLLAIWSDAIDEDAFERLWALLQRRAAGEPVQYIMGEAYFYGRRFAVDKTVLIPRPETELLAERVLLLGTELWGAAGAPRVVDVGTGSGAIAVTLAAERPSWRVAASDISPEALETARRNAEANGASLEFLLGDLLEPAAKAYGGGGIDILVSNPPYIRSADMAELQVEVREFEPHLALDGGEDGLDPYRRLLAQMASFGVRPRIVGFECGLGQARDLAKLLQAAGRWTDVSIVEDYAGIERHVIGVRK